MMLAKVIRLNVDNSIGLVESEEDKKQYLFSLQEFQKVDERDLVVGALVEIEWIFGTDKINSLHYPLAKNRKNGLFLL
ncbi:MAG: hypothetical protein Q4B71_07680 [Cardiobacteriaceae bacterium]|nr:hypothetical protein [Cardiobacteriaceae bacterium]